MSEDYTDPMAKKIADDWNKPKWISVKDRLPDNKQRVLVCNINDYFPIVSRYRDITIEVGWDTWMSPAGDCKVTHWMALPEPPV